MTRVTNMTAASSTSLPVVKSAAQTRQPRPAVSRVGGAAKRLLNALMRSLATPHI